MAKRKIVFVIVEGPSDEKAIGSLFDYVFNPDEVYVEVMHCDILTDYLFNGKNGHNFRNSNILIELKEIVENYIVNNRGINKSDIKEIIHICDTDGCFSPDDVLVEDTSLNGTIYKRDSIITKDKNSYINVRKLKRENINKLITTSFIWTNIPYRLYYMSSSLDDVLYNKLNLTDDEKRNEAHLFVKKYINNWDKCISFFSSTEIIAIGNYNETWEYIKKDLNSLKRCSNINLCFPKKE